MPQLNYDQDQGIGLVGEMHNVVRMQSGYRNPLLPQITEVDVTGGTTDGTYTVSIRQRGKVIATFSYVAVSKTAAQIAAGLVAAALGDPTTAGLLDTAAVTDTDSCSLYFRAAGEVYDVVVTSDPSATLVVVLTQAAGYTEVLVGALLQSNDAGGYEAWDGDGPAALGVVGRNASLINEAYNVNNGLRDGSLPIMAEGEINVTIQTGDTVLQGDGPAFYYATDNTWRNDNGGGTHVIVEGSQFTRGNGVGNIARVYVKFPLHS